MNVYGENLDLELFSEFCLLEVGLLFMCYLYILLIDISGDVVFGNEMDWLFFEKYNLISLEYVFKFYYRIS